MDRRCYLQNLYSFQDEVLRLCSMIDESGFYLTGGTALARGYLNHRLSDGLDFFVNDDDRFSLWADRMILHLTRVPQWHTQRSSFGKVFQRHADPGKLQALDHDHHHLSKNKGSSE